MKLCQKARERAQEILREKKRREYEASLREACNDEGICPRCGRDLRWRKQGGLVSVPCFGSVQFFVAKCCGKKYEQGQKTTD
jgi:C4-type Zn-finger protein